MHTQINQDQDYVSSRPRLWKYYLSTDSKTYFLRTPIQACKYVCKSFHVMHNKLAYKCLDQHVIISFCFKTNLWRIEKNIGKPLTLTVP